MGVTGESGWLLLAGVLLALGCAREDVELARQPKAAPAAGTPAPQAPEGGAPDLEREPYQLFERALCSCSDATFSGAFAADAFDSGEGPYVQGRAGADLGIDNQFVAASTVDVLGALVAAGTGLLPITLGPYRVEGNFETNADLTITGSDVTFGRDLWVNGEILALGLVTVTGDVIQPAGHTGADTIAVGGQVRTVDFTVPPPCACAEGEILDIEAIVADGMARNHNRELGVGADALFTSGDGTTLELACGRLAFEGGYVAAGTALQVRGRAALFIAGDLTIAGRFATDPQALDELDVFVAGDLILADGAELGSIARPSALRLYVSGPGDIAVISALSFGANLYAPRASVYLTTPQTWHGALFVEAYTSVGDQVLHYDSAVLRAPAPDDACPDPL